MSEKRSTSVRLSDDCRKSIRQMAKSWGLRDAGVVEFAVQVLQSSGVSPADAVANIVTEKAKVKSNGSKTHA